MAAVSAISFPSAPRQWRLAAAILLVVAGLLVLCYYWFIASDYAILVQGSRPEEAAAIVQELKKETIPFELRDGGATILVPASQLDAARLDISGDDLSFKGTVGFELFNQSDMGLTEFAQKVNYQRALQGEIARTIMAMDGFSFARVHLALPEHSLFRNSGSEPRAAVTLIPRPGVEIDPQRIAGIQRLVAAAVPDLALDQVAILNERGELLTPAYSDPPRPIEANSLEDQYRARAASAASVAAPGTHLDIQVTLVPNGAASAISQPAESGQQHQAVHLVLFERSHLSLAQEQTVRIAVTHALSLDPWRGDTISFSPAPVMAPPAPSASRAEASSWAAPDSGPSQKERLMSGIARGWAVALGALALISIAIAGRAWRQRTLARREILVGRIREHLLLGGVADAA